MFDETGVRVARTKLSRSFRANTQLGDSLLREIRLQLGLRRTSDLRDLVDCTISRRESTWRLSRANSTGIEHVDDLLADLEQALEVATPAGMR
ncbi:MAG: hypothetical protein DCC58_20365 [Chloroflexi bacterium]|nr:MAG: hypothetical protein DCC58_20365 [Chloroflexota bacterium]